MTITILFNGQDFGPFSPEQARILVEDGTVSASDLARGSAEEEWRPLRTVLRENGIVVAAGPARLSAAAGASASSPASPGDQPSAIRAPQVVIVAIVLLLATGVAAFFYLPRSSDTFPVGTWAEVSGPASFVFNQDHTVVFKDEGIDFAGTWQWDDKNIVLTFATRHRIVPLTVLNYTSSTATLRYLRPRTDPEGLAEHAVTYQTMLWRRDQ